MGQVWTMDTERYRVQTGSDVTLLDRPTADADEVGLTKQEAGPLLLGYNERLGDLQQLLYADGGHKVLVVLQGMDTSGKDGTIKNVFAQINPLGVRVANFKRPNDVEKHHDFLWRVHYNAPKNGQIMIFNRSHYEDVLVVRVHEMVPADVIERRYGHIANFERLLVDEGTVIRKFFLHISKDEQRRRLQERLDNKAKNWKFEHGDIEERKRWDDYQKSYELAISRTCTDDAPWYVVPADQKWFRNLIISHVLIDTLEGMNLAYPPPRPDLARIKIN